MKSPRTSRPGSGNKYFITRGKGGYSTCIQGKPTDSQCNVLANCVGYACGAYNEEHEFGYEKYHLNCNAENFIERAIASGLSVYQNPMPGGIIVWQKGSLSSGDGAGHVAICTWVNDVYNPTQMKTAESGYGAKSPFWMTTRNKGNGNWGQASTYKYRGCIAPEGYKPPEPKPVITPNVERDKTKDQIEVLIDQLYVRTDGTKSATALGFAHKGFYNYTSMKENDGYKWYQIADKQWIASNEGWTNVLPKEEPKPIELKYKLGDVMTFTGFLYADAKGNGKGEERKNLKCTITKTWNEAGTTKPYNINNGLGWVAEADLTPYVEPPKPTPTPTTELKEGDKVQIIGTGKSSVDGSGRTAYGIGWTRHILKVWKDKNGNLRSYPYQVGEGKATTGFYKKESLKKL